MIQLGAILAVCWEFRRRIGSVLTGLAGAARRAPFRLNVIIATIPAVVLGLLFEKAIKGALVFAGAGGGRAGGRRGGDPVGGSAAACTWRAARRACRASIDLSALDALKVGLAQCFALIPGMSRSGSTIIGGMLFGLERRVATEFSFFLAIPIIFGATAYEMLKTGICCPSTRWACFAIGFVAAFVSAFVCVRWLLRYIAAHDFTAFAWYRIGFGLLILMVGYSGALSWADVSRRV